MAKSGGKGIPLAESFEVVPEMPEIPDPPAASAEELPVVQAPRGAGASATPSPNPTIVPARRNAAPAAEPRADREKPSAPAPAPSRSKPEPHPKPETKRPAAAPGKTTNPKIPVAPANKPWNPFAATTPAAAPAGSAAAPPAPASTPATGESEVKEVVAPPVKAKTTEMKAPAASTTPAAGSTGAAASGNAVRYLLGYAAGSALAILLLVVALVGARGKAGELESKLRGLKSENEVLRASPSAAPSEKGAKMPPGELERLAGELDRARQQIAALQREVELLRRQNGELAARTPSDRAVEASPWAPPPAPSTPPPAWSETAPPITPPDPGSMTSAADQYPGEGTGEPWGASEDGELDEMASVLKLNPEQREVVKRIIMDGQSEFERALIALGQSGERDITAIERIGEDISRRTQERIRQVLYPEQQAAFRELMQQKEGER